MGADEEIFSLSKRLGTNLGMKTVERREGFTSTTIHTQFVVMCAMFK